MFYKEWTNKNSFNVSWRLLKQLKKQNIAVSWANKRLELFLREICFKINL